MMTHLGESCCLSSGSDARVCCYRGLCLLGSLFDTVIVASSGDCFWLVQLLGRLPSPVIVVVPSSIVCLRNMGGRLMAIRWNSWAPLVLQLIRLDRFEIMSGFVSKSLGTVECGCLGLRISYSLWTPLEILPNSRLLAWLPLMNSTHSVLLAEVVSVKW